MTLKRKTFSAVRWTSAAAAFRAVLQITQVAVLARLLSPEDYGLMAMVGAVLGFAGIFTDIGLNSAFVQRQRVTETQRSSLFWLNVAVGAGVTLLVVAASPLFSKLFGDERLTPLMMLSATTFVVGSVGQQVRMAAEKELNFRPVVLLETTAALLGFLTALISAIAGCGVYSLVFGGMVSTISGTVFAWMFIAEGWRPMWRLCMGDVRSYLAFGGAIVGSNIVNQINMTIDILLGGRLLGAVQLGLYSVPRNLVLQVQFLVNPIVTRVGFPLIAQVQTDLKRVRSIYLKTLSMTAAINAFLYVGITFFAPDIVDVLLGDGWRGSMSLLRVLAVWGFVRSIVNPVGSLLLGMGRADLAFKWNITLLFIIPPVLWGGSIYGSVGLARTLLGLSIFLFIPSWYFLVKPLCGATLGEYFARVARPLAIAVVAVFIGYICVMSLAVPVVRLTVGLFLSITCYFAMGYFFNREWFHAMRELIWQ